MSSRWTNRTQEKGEVRGRGGPSLLKGRAGYLTPHRVGSLVYRPLSATGRVNGVLETMFSMRTIAAPDVKGVRPGASPPIALCRGSRFALKKGSEQGVRLGVIYPKCKISDGERIHVRPSRVLGPHAIGPSLTIKCGTGPDSNLENFDLRR